MERNGFHIMIMSKYLNTFKDFKSLEIVFKKFNENILKFHFNSIPLDERTWSHLFNLETLHLYSEDDVRFKDGIIFNNMKFGYNCFSYCSSFPNIIIHSPKQLIKN